MLNAQVAVTSAGLYLAWQSVPTDPNAGSMLAHADAVTGRVLARRRLPGGFGDAVAAAGSLWVMISSAPGMTLLRLDPQTLRTGAQREQWFVRRGGTHAQRRRSSQGFEGPQRTHTAIYGRGVACIPSRDEERRV
jgi:hypothetical protein